MSAKDPRRLDPKLPATPLPADSEPLAEIELGNEGAIEFNELPPSQEASKVALAQLPDPPSGQSLTTWTEVIRRQRAAQDESGSGKMQVDAPSDKDLLTRLAGDAAARAGKKQPGDTSEILPSEMPIFGQAPASTDSGGGSAIDLGKALAGRAAGGSEVRFDILYPPSDA